MHKLFLLLLLGNFSGKDLHRIENRKLADCEASLKSEVIRDQIFNFQKTPKSIQTGISSTSADPGCQITMCGLYRKNGSSEYLGQNIQISTSSPFVVSFEGAEQSGYEETIVIKCSTKNGQSIATNSFKVQQTNTCGSALRTSTVTESTFAYQPSGWYDLQNTGISSSNAKCPISNCQIFNKDGVTKNNNSRFSQTNNKVQLRADSRQGYSDEIVIQCETIDGAQVVKSNAFNINQRHQCSQSLRYNQNTKTETTFVPVEDKVLRTVDINNPIVSSYLAACPLTSCTLEPSNNVSWVGSDFAKIQLKRETFKGWTESLLLTCSNGVQTLSQSVMFKQLDYPCKTAFGIVEVSPSPLVVAYSSGSSGRFTADIDWSKQFKNSAPNQCSPLKCEILNEDGSAPSQDSRIQMSQGAPWKITYQANAVEGWAATFYVQCSTHFQTVKHRYSVTQQGRCAHAMKPLADQFTLTKLNYKDEEAMTVVGDAYANFFTNTDVTNCPITKCQLLQKGCVKPWTDPFVTLDVTQEGKWTIKALSNEFEGHTSYLCVECTNGDGTYPRQVIQKDDYIINQPAKCMDALSQAADFEPVVIKYEEGVKNIATFDSFFKNDDPKCVVQSCQLKEKDCVTQYIKDNVRIEESAPWNIKLMTAKPNGFVDDICVVCKNKLQTIESSLQVTQTGHCFEKLMKQPVDGTMATLPYQEADSTQVLASASSFFKDMTNGKCPITQCELLDETCESSFTREGITIEQSSPFNVLARSNVILGFNYNICVKCSNGQYAVTNKMAASQTSKCQNVLALKDNVLEYVVTFDEFDNRGLRIGQTAVERDDDHLTGTYLEFFTNADDINCPDIQCEMKAEGCEDKYMDDKILMGPNPMFTMRSAVNLKPGYTSRFCLKCTNGFQSIQQDSIIVTQTNATPWITVLTVSIVVATFVMAACSLQHQSAQEMLEIEKERRLKIEEEQKIENVIQRVRQTSFREARNSMKQEMRSFSRRNSISSSGTRGSHPRTGSWQGSAIGSFGKRISMKKPLSHKPDSINSGSFMDKGGIAKFKIGEIKEVEVHIEDVEVVDIEEGGLFNAPETARSEEAKK